MDRPNRVGITAPSGDSTTRLATTAFVAAAIAGFSSAATVTSIGGVSGVITLGTGLSIAGSTLSATASVTAETYQTLTASSGTYAPTSSTVKRIKVRMCGGGGGAGAQATNNGSSGATTTFSTSTPWTAIGGGLGQAGALLGGAGGSGGANGTGTLIFRLAGGAGGTGGVSNGGTNPFGAAGAAAGASSSPQQNAPANSGGGGGGLINGGGGGGAGEYVEFFITSPSSSIAWVNGAGGAGGAPGTLGGGAGGSGVILVEEFYY